MKKVEKGNNIKNEEQMDVTSEIRPEYVEVGLRVYSVFVSSI